MELQLCILLGFFSVMSSLSIIFGIPRMVTFFIFVERNVSSVMSFSEVIVSINCSTSSVFVSSSACMISVFLSRDVRHVILVRPVLFFAALFSNSLMVFSDVLVDLLRFRSIAALERLCLGINCCFLSASEYCFCACVAGVSCSSSLVIVVSFSFSLISSVCFAMLMMLSMFSFRVWLLVPRVCSSFGFVWICIWTPNKILCISF